MCANSPIVCAKELIETVISCSIKFIGVHTQSHTYTHIHSGTYIHSGTHTNKSSKCLSVYVMTCSVFLYLCYTIFPLRSCLCIIGAFLVYYARLMWLWYIDIWLDYSACHCIISGEPTILWADIFHSIHNTIAALLFPIFFRQNVWSLRHFNLHRDLST